MTKKEEENRLLKRSSEFLKTATYQTNNGLYDLATFSLQQALELFLKAKVLANGIDYPRTHSVRELLEILIEVVTDGKKLAIKQTSDRYLLELSMLEDAYITSRYVAREFTVEEVKGLTRAVKEVMKAVE